LKLVPPSIPDRSPKAMSGSMSTSKIETIGNEVYDAECLKLINEYFYGVRIFPGQDPTHVYVGWVTTQYHLHSTDFNQTKVRKGSIFINDDMGRIIERYL
jgi:ryanodine receptor 2